jgi:hypothetical protein
MTGWEGDSIFKRRIHDRLLAARFARGMNVCLPKEEGAGKTGCALHPRSRVQNCAKNAHTSIQVQRKHSGLPRAMALRFITRSPPRRIPLVTVVRGLMTRRTRSGRLRLHELDISNGCQAHTISPYAARPRKRSAGQMHPRRSFPEAGFGAVRTTRRSIAHGKPALQSPCAPTLPRPPHPNPRS